MESYGILLLFVGAVTLAAAAPVPGHHPQHREIQQAHHTTQPEYEYDYEGTAPQADPEESASHYDTYISEVQQSNGDKKGYSRGSGLRTIAVGSANQAKTALGNQAAAGYQAAYVAKNTLAQSAAQASATAQAALAGKQVIMSGLEQQVRDAKVALQAEEMQLQQSQRAAQSAAQAAQQAMHQVNVIQAALNAAQATSENANESAQRAAGEYGAQTAMVGAAKQRLSTLQEQLHGVRIDFEATQSAAMKAQIAAQQAQANAADAAAKAAAAGLGGHKDAAYEETKEEYQTSELSTTTSKPNTTTSFESNTTADPLITYPNIGPVKFEFIIPPLLEELEQEQMISISNEMDLLLTTSNTMELDSENHELLTTQANINSTLDTTSHNISRNASRFQTHIRRRQISEDVIRNALQRTEPTQPVHEDTSATSTPAIIQRNNTGYNHYQSEHRYNPSKLQKLLQDANIYKTNHLNTQQKYAIDFTKPPGYYIPIPLGMQSTTQANFYLKSHTSMFKYEPRYQFHRNSDYLESNAQLDKIKTAPQNTSFTISNLTDPEYKRAHSNSAPSIGTLTPHTAQVSKSHRNREEPIHEIDIPFEEVTMAQKYNSVVEKALQKALFKMPKSTKLGQSSTRTLIAPSLKSTTYQPWYITYKPRTHVTLHNDYPNISSQINDALKKNKRSKATDQNRGSSQAKAEEPQQKEEEEDCEEEK